MRHQNIIRQKIHRDSYISTCYVENVDLLKRIKIKIIEKSNNSSLDYKTNVKAKFTGFDSLIKEPEIEEFIRCIEPFLSNTYDKVTILKECWGNIYKGNDHTLLHHHQDCSGFSGILYLTEGGPGTYFPDFDITINEEYGKVVLFDPLLLHQVKPYNLKKDRITMAFNCEERKPWS